MSELLSVTQAAARLKVHRTRVLQWIQAGRLPATMIGKSGYVIEADDLKAMESRPRSGRPPKTPSA